MAAWNEGAVVAQPRLMWGCLILLAVSLLFTPVLAQTFPALTSRVVDQANILPHEAKTALENKLRNFEVETTSQIVVATIPSLAGLTVEAYANRLFNFWQLGQKEKNNGVLLLVAPAERRVRIEVGYGLEHILTNPRSKRVLDKRVLPRFQNNDFAGGVEAGIDAIISILGGDTHEFDE